MHNIKRAADGLYTQALHIDYAQHVGVYLSPVKFLIDLLYEAYYVNC